jgi:malate dehydrogenase (oxaloacetate-decarboxylating)(NADP+)
MLQLIDKGRSDLPLQTWWCSWSYVFLSDTAINIDPSADDLAKIALWHSKTARMFGVDPVIMVSFSNLVHRVVQKVSKLERQ